MSAGELVDFRVPGGAVTEEGLHTNVSLGARYLDSWLRGVGTAAIDKLMEDAATAEISRAQVWSWIRAGRFTAERVREELAQVDPSADAKELFAEVTIADEFVEFLTIPAYRRLG